jgi:Circularly permutated YpsA SLOG family
VSATQRQRRGQTESPQGRTALTIISGGQTGADRAALDVALALGIPCGGWCPADRAAEDGTIPARYPLTPLPRGGGYRERTRRNVQDSDGTVIFSFGSLTGGSKATAGDCRRFHRPCLVINANEFTPTEAALLLAVFILRHHVRRLNVAGPRASGQPGIYEYVRSVLRELLARPARRTAGKRRER